MLRLACPILLTGLAVAQGTVTFAPKHPMLRLEVHDLPGLLAAAQDTALGRLFADPEVAETWQLGRQRYLDHADRWLQVVEALQRAAPAAATVSERAEVTLRRLDWRDIHGFSLCATLPDEEQRERLALVGGNPVEGFVEPFVTLALQPTMTGEPRVRALLDTLAADLRQHPPHGTTVLPDQAIHGEPALVLVPGGEVDLMAQALVFQTQQTAPFWLTAQPGLVAGGSGSHEIGAFRATRPATPSFRLGVHLGRYMKMMAAMIDAPSSIDASLEATGMHNAGMLEWRLSCTGDRVQDDLSLAFDGPIGGILGAMLIGMAPLPAQPLPERGLLQLRCAFDVAALVAAVDKLLVLRELRTLTEQGILDDLRRAWTGGTTIALTRPAPGGLVPRIYGSFGVVDREALDRLLARLQALPFVTTRQRELAGTDCTLLEIEGLPSALQPAYCLLGDTIHFAESAQSLRELLKAVADDRPPALDVDDAPRPEALGTLMPNFDLRFDGAEIHAAMQQIWLPLLTMSMALLDDEPFVTLDEMPDVETVTAHLVKGRGALRRTPDGITLSMSGTLGGPATHALAAMYGPVFSMSIGQSQTWQLEELRSRLACVHLLAIHKAIAAFEKRDGKRPPSLGALLAAGDLADPAMLLIAGDEVAEPVMHDDRQIGKSSYRYYPEGLTVSPDGNEVKTMLIAIHKAAWYRYAMDLDGQLHMGWGDFAEQSIDEIEKAARATGKDK